MKTYYLDEDYRLHLSPADGLTQWEDVDGYFDNKCAEYIEGFRVVPEGEKWVRSDGEVFYGLMRSAVVPFEDLDEIQRKYEQRTIQELQQTVAELDEALLDSTYNNIIGGI